MRVKIVKDVVRNGVRIAGEHAVVNLQPIYSITDRETFHYLLRENTYHRVDPSEYREILETENEVVAAIAKTREYLDYIEEHYKNVQRAWKEVQEKCGAKGFPFLSDDHSFWMIDGAVKHHNLSKLSHEEFIPYRERYFPVRGRELDVEVGEEHVRSAWLHHYENNPHHPENWAKREFYHPHEATWHCVHMVIDLIAMSYKLGGTAREYYLTNTNKLCLPEWAHKLVLEIFDAFYGEEQHDNNMDK